LDITLLSEDLQRIICDAVERSKHITGCTLNICFGYTSTDEMTRATQYIAEGVQNHILQPSDIDIELFEECLDTQGCTKPDIVIRTSGEIRLSDFMLWQSTYSCLVFCDALWPEFTVTHLYSIILQYQRNYPQLQEMRRFAYNLQKNQKAVLNEDQLQKKQERINSFKSWRKSQYALYLQKLQTDKTA